MILFSLISSLILVDSVLYSTYVGYLGSLNHNLSWSNKDSRIFQKGESSLEYLWFFSFARDHGLYSHLINLLLSDLYIFHLKTALKVRRNVVLPSEFWSSLCPWQLIDLDMSNLNICFDFCFQLGLPLENNNKYSKLDTSKSMSYILKPNLRRKVFFFALQLFAW